MMNKKVSLLLLGLLMVGFVSATCVPGTKATQRNYDALEFNKAYSNRAFQSLGGFTRVNCDYTRDSCALNMSYYTWEQDLSPQQSIVIVNETYNYTETTYYHNGNYYCDLKYRDVTFTYSKFYNYYNSLGSTLASNWLTSTILNKVDYYLTLDVDKLKKWQTRTVINPSLSI